MGTPTRWQIALRAAQQPVTHVLKPLNFRKVGNYYNRKGADGLVQVVGFQSGQAHSSLHGTFTVNLGVYVPCIWGLEGKAGPGRYVTDAHCEIRSRLSDVAGLGNDQWWPLDGSASQYGSAIASAVLSHGVRFLDEYASYTAIIERFREDGSLPSHNSGRSALAVAIIQWSRGAIDDSLQLFERARTYNSRFADYVTTVQSRCGI